MARRRNSSRSIFHTAVGPERRVVESPDIEPRLAADLGVSEAGPDTRPLPKQAAALEVDGRDQELAAREAAVLRAMTKATLHEQRELLAELNGIRAEKTARLAASRELDLANAVVADHLSPIVSTGSRSSAKSDWLGDVPALAPRDMSHDVIVEAAMFWRDLHTAVKADVEELVEQASGRARVVASRFEAEAPAARRMFMEEIVRLAAAHPAQEPADDGVATSTLPVAVNPSDAPETFDTDTLSAADREAIHDSQMADSDFAQKYQKSSVLAAINDTMWAKLGGFETEDDDDYDAAENKWQSKNDDTKDTGGDSDEDAENDDDSPFPPKDKDSGKPWEKKDASHRTAGAYDDARWVYVDGGQESGWFSDSEKDEMEGTRQPGATFTWRALTDAERASMNSWYAEQSYAQSSLRNAPHTAAQTERDYGGSVSYTWKNDKGERFRAADKDDNGPVYKHWEDGKYNADCPYCWLGHGHTEKAHAAGIASYTRTSARRTKTAGQVLDLCQQIVASKQAQDVNGVLLDMQTANAIMTVYSALSPENQAGWEKLVESKPIDWVAEKAWSLLGSTGATAARTAGAPTVMGPDQDLKNAPKAEQDAYWNWVGQMSADSDSGYYVPLNFKSWRGSYWDDSKSNTTYAPDLPPMASSRRTAVSLTRVRLDGDNGIGVDPQGNTVRFRLTPKERQDLATVLFSDMAINFSGVDVEESDIIREGSRRRTAADEPAKDGAAESTLPVAINPSDAPEGLDQLNENPQPATGMVGEGSGPAPQAAAAGGPTTFNDFVKDHSKAAAFRARVQANLARTR